MAVKFSLQPGNALTELINTATPTEDLSAANKAYVDNHSGITGAITPERLQNFSEIVPVADSDGYTSIFGIRNRHLSGSEDTEFHEADLLFRVRSNERQYFYGRTPSGQWREAVLYIPIDVENNYVYRMLAITENHHFHQMTATGNYVRGGTPGTGIDVDDTDTFTVTEWFNYDSELIVNARIDSEFWATRAYVNANSGHQSFRGPWVATASYAAGDVVTYTFPATETGTFANLSDQTRIYQASSAVAANSTRPPQNTLFREVGTDQTVELSDMPTRTQQTGRNGYYLQLDTTGTEPRYVLTDNVATDTEVEINRAFLQSQIDTNDTELETLRTYVDDHVLSVPVNKATGHHAPLQITGIRYNDAQIRWYVPPGLATQASALATNLNALRGGDNSADVQLSVQAWDGSDFQTERYQIICNQINYLGPVGNTHPYILFQGSQVNKNGAAAGINLQSDPEDGYFSDFSMYANNSHVGTIHTVQSVSVDSEYFAIPANGVLVYSDTDNTLHWQNLRTLIDSEAITQTELDTQLRGQLDRLGLDYEDNILTVQVHYTETQPAYPGQTAILEFGLNNLHGGTRQVGDTEQVTITWDNLGSASPSVHTRVITPQISFASQTDTTPTLLATSVVNDAIADFTANPSAWPDIHRLYTDANGGNLYMEYSVVGAVNRSDFTIGSDGFFSGGSLIDPGGNLIYNSDGGGRGKLIRAGADSEAAQYSVENAGQVELPDWDSHISAVQSYASDIDERARHEVYGLPVGGNTGAVGPLHIDSWSYNDTELVLTLDSEAAVGNQGLEALFQNFYDNGFNLPNNVGDLDIGFKVVWFDTDTNAFQTDSVFVYPHHGNMVIDTDAHTITFTPVSGQAVFLQVNQSTPSATTVTNGSGYLSNLDFQNADNSPYLSVIELPDTIGEQYHHYSSIPAGQVLVTTSGGVAGDTEWSLVNSNTIGASLYTRLRNDQIYTAIHYSDDPNVFPTRVDTEEQLVNQDIRLRSASGDTDYYYSHFNYGIYVNDGDSEFQINSIEYYAGRYQIPTGLNIDHIPLHLPGSVEITQRPLRPNLNSDSDTYPYLNGILYRGQRVNLVVGDLFIAPRPSDGQYVIWRCTAVNNGSAAGEYDTVNIAPLAGDTESLVVNGTNDLSLTISAGGASNLIIPINEPARQDYRMTLTEGANTYTGTFSDPNITSTQNASPFIIQYSAVTWDTVPPNGTYTDIAIQVRNSQTAAVNVAEQNEVITATFTRATDGTYQSKTVTYP